MPDPLAESLAPVDDLGAPGNSIPISASRSSALDAVRVIAVLAVVAGHTYVTPWVGPLIFTWHVPVFFVLSGYLWSPGRDILHDVGKRTRTLLVPYVSWLTLVTVCWVWYVDHAGRRLPPEFYSNLIKGGAAISRPYSAYWFITAMFVAVVLARLIERVAGRGAVWLIGTAGVVGVVIGARNPDALMSIWLGAGLALPCMAFLAAGMLLRDLRTRIEQPLLLGGALLLAGWQLINAGSHSLNIKYSEFSTPARSMVVGVLIPVGMVLVAEGLFVGRFRQIGWISTFALASLPVVLGHSLVLGLLDGRAVPPFTTFLVAAAVPWCIGLVALRVSPLRALLL